MKMSIATIAAGILLALPASAAQDLMVGDKAPALQIGKWIKGEPVESFAPGKAHVVEFWATWCGPCKVSIPHLTELQKKHPDVRFIGVSVWERDPSKVEPFVESMGDTMGYAVAMDDVPVGDERGSNGAMAKGWMTAAGQRGIPSAFIIDQQGRVAWIGHPMRMDEPLAKIAAGEWDIEKAAVAHRNEKKVEALVQRAGEHMRAGEYAEALKAADEAIALDASKEEQVAMLRFDALRMGGQADKALAYGTRLVDEVLAKNAFALNGVAWQIVDPQGGTPDAALLKLALRAATRANELTEDKNWSILDTLARVHFAMGDAKKAISIQERAVQLAPEKAKPEAQKTLDEYRRGGATG